MFRNAVLYELDFRVIRILSSLFLKVLQPRIYSGYGATISLLIASFFLFHLTSFSQSLPSSPVFVPGVTFTSEQGLSQNNVSCIRKDQDGFVWIGTSDGLNRFDGYSFVHFSHSDEDSTSISNDVIRNLLLDSKGRLWVGTYYGLNLYDSESETFRNFLTSPGDENTISQNTIISLIEDRNHHLWVGTYWGLTRINLETFEMARYFYQPDGRGLADNAVNALLEDRNGKIWACTAKGINIIGPNGIEKTIYQSDEPNGLSPELVIGIVQDSTGSIYLGTNGSGILHLESETDETFEQFVYQPGKSSIGNNIISAMEIDRKGILLIGTDGAGLYRYEGNARFTKILVRESRILDNGSVHEVFVDEQNNYWVGFFGAGLTFISGEPPRFDHYRYFDASMERMGKNSVLAIVEDHNQKIWIGTDGAGLYKFDPVTKRFTSYLHRPTKRNSISTNAVKSLLVDHKNNLYIGTFAGGLNYLDTKTEIFSRYLHDPSDTTSISTNHVWSLLESNKHQIYTGLLGGLNEFLPEKKAFRILTIAGENPVTTNTASVFSMKEDKNGNIWMGTRLAGIHRYDPTMQSFEAFINIPGDSTSFPTNEILEFQIDSEKRLLIGTDNKGLIRFDPETFTFTKLIPEFREKNIPSILEDDARNLWFTSFDGLHRYDPVTGKIFNYTVADGLQGVQYNEGARLKSSTGDYYFGGTNGLNIFRPEIVLEDRNTKPIVVFTKLSLFHDVVGINDQSGVLTRSISNTKMIVLQPTQNVFSIEFACLEYKFPKKNRYRYYLRGFDKSWNEIQENRTATYTNLPPGDYTLLVGATNQDGYWNDEAASIQIIIIPRWYQRTSVRIGFVFLFTIFILAIIHIRTNFLFRQKRKLAHMVKLRTELIQTKNEQIKDKNEKLEQAYEEVHSVNDQLQRVNTNLEKLVEERTDELRLTLDKLMESNKGLDTFLYRASHDLRGPIATLLGLANVAKMQNHQNELVSYFGSMESIASRMLQLLQRLSDTGTLFRAKCNMEIINIDEFVQSILKQLSHLSSYHTVKIEIENKVGESITCDRMLLNHIIVNLMENSIVFRGEKNPFTKCTFFFEGRHLIIQVSDNGIGISAEVRDLIFDMFYRGSERSIGNGLGLFMAKKSLEILNGSITIESGQNQLTMFMVRIPLSIN